MADGSKDDWCFRDSAKVSHLSPAYSTKAWGIVGLPHDMDTLYKTLFGDKNATNKDGSVIHYYPLQTLAFYVSSNTAERCASRFEFRNVGGPVSHTKASIYTNGTLCVENVPITATLTKVGVDFPAGAFKPGLNLISVSNASENVGKSSQYASFNLDYYKFEVTLPKSGTTIMVR